MPKTKIFLSILLLLFAISNCFGQETYKVKVKDGVRHVHNLAPKWGDEEKLSLEYVRMFGGMEIEDEELMLNSPVNVARDKYGCIYIVDQS